MRQVHEHAYARPALARVGAQDALGLGTLEVVHRGDPERVEPAHRPAHALEVLPVARPGLERREGPHRMLAQHAGRLPGGIALDEPALGVGGRARDPGACQGRRAHPQRVEVAAVEQDHAVPGDAIERGPIRRLAPVVRVPAAPHDHRVGGTGREVARQALERLGPCGAPVKRQLVERARPLDQVDMGVGAARGHGAAAGVEAPRARAREGLELGAAPERHDRAPGDRDRVGALKRRTVGPRPGVHHQQVTR